VISTWGGIYHHTRLPNWWLAHVNFALTGVMNLDASRWFFRVRSPKDGTQQQGVTRDVDVEKDADQQAN
tara:strand:- start:16525 stop:16731 length:207 start_codon:yes stop_codon:yes gene_type:complete